MSSQVFKPISELDKITITNLVHNYQKKGEQIYCWKKGNVLEFTELFEEEILIPFCNLNPMYTPYDIEYIIANIVRLNPFEGEAE